ncbi:hypothetical protein NEISUBOT_05476 [Neisseria subflava NJ9703]|uniref:Uncharacterized protein n=1 Tax=Neisseria subflava NJ9703 TaxID=546268 RepID=A0A9W5MY91_NEISU|nr:hypothetical protein NEISUBOT_05476 [Neisseria subflava NJ9703]
MYAGWLDTGSHVVGLCLEPIQNRPKNPQRIRRPTIGRLNHPERLSC